MHRVAARFLLLIFPSFVGVSAWAQASASRVEPASERSAEAAAPVAPGPQMLFGSLPISTNSIEARKFIELSWDKYENAAYDTSLALAHKAADKDQQSALAYAMVSFSARRLTPDPAALAKAKTLLPHATPDEQLLVRWMTSIQDRELLPAIMNMNDLLKRFGKDKHVLYLMGEWLFLQEDDDRARSLLESALTIDPNFPAALNRLGYVYMQSGNPDPAKALASLRHYAEVEPSNPNPQDSLGEISRMAGDDQASLEHYSASLRIDPTFSASQIGLGDTRVLLGDYEGARKEYDLAVKMAGNPRDELYVKGQRALTFFWEGRAAEGHKALAVVAEEARTRKEPNTQADIALERAMLTTDPKSELEQLHALSTFLEKPLAGMLESDRGIERAFVLRERARIASLNGWNDEALQAVSQLEELATSSRDTLVENAFESARGYLVLARGDLDTAADGLAADPHSPLALQALASTHEKLHNTSAAELAATCLKFHRAPTVEWYLATRQKQVPLTSSKGTTQP
jgi:tetratricopeptide (TPR) repeat protein